jgi:SNF2 family DNA or RNA helicase
MEMFVDEYDAPPSFEKSSNLMAYMAKMRHITGQSKISDTIDFTMEFLESTDRKLCIFVHHKDVGVELAKRIRESVYEDVNTGEPTSTEVLELTAGNPNRDTIVQQFNSKEKGTARVMVASTLASGEGLNLQSWSDCIIHERQWNPANEEQVEGRFIRIGQQSSRVTANYMLAVGTIDDYFSELVERKRQYCKSSYGEEYVQWDESSLMKELMETLATKGRQQWRL